MEDGRRWFVFWAVGVTIIPGIKPIWRADRDEWYDFLKTVRDDVIDPMTIEAFLVLQHQMQSKIDSCRNTILARGGSKAADKKLDDLQADLDAMTVAWENVGEKLEAVRLEPERASVELDDTGAVTITPKRGRPAKEK